jgi:hypothetical protein
MALQPGPGRKAALWAGGMLLVAGLALWVSACSRNHPSLAIGKTTEGPSEETREFDISVDGKPAGQYVMEINRADQETLVMSGQAAVRVKYLFYTYTYTYRGTETYRDDRLVALTSTCNDNGKQFNLSARAEGEHLRLVVNGQEKARPANVWTTSYWQLPPDFLGKEVVLLEPDTGKRMKGHLRYLDKVKLAVAGQEMECRHYRVTGSPSPVDLWYDGERRLVRQQYVDEGHPTHLELKKLSRGQ